MAKPQPKVLPEAPATVGTQLSELVKFLVALDDVAASEDMKARKEWEEYTTNLTVHMDSVEMANHLESLESVDSEDTEAVLASANKILGRYHAMGNQPWTQLPCFRMVSDDCMMTL